MTTRNGKRGTKSSLSQAYGLEPESSRSQLAHLRIPISLRLTTTCLKKTIQQLKGIKNPLVETMQIRVNPTYPREQWKNRDHTDHDDTQHPQYLSKASHLDWVNPLFLIPLSTSATDLRRLRKKTTGARGRVQEVLGTVHINLISLSSPFQPTRSPATNSSATKTPATNT